MARTPRKNYAKEAAYAAGTVALPTAANITGTLPIANGGTAAVTATLARNAIGKGATALADAASITTDCSTGNFFTVTLTDNRTLATPTGMAAGAQYVWVVTQDGTGSHTLAYGGAFDWGAAGAPTLTTAAGKSDYIAGYSPDGTKLHASIAKGFT